MSKSAFEQMNLELDDTLEAMRGKPAGPETEPARASGKPKPSTDGTDWRKWVYQWQREHAPEWLRNGGK